jgi:hypothetical protein
MTTNVALPQSWPVSLTEGPDLRRSTHNTCPTIFNRGARLTSLNTQNLSNDLQQGGPTYVVQHTILVQRSSKPIDHNLCAINVSSIELFSHQFLWIAENWRLILKLTYKTKTDIPETTLKKMSIRRLIDSSNWRPPVGKCLSLDRCQCIWSAY